MPPVLSSLRAVWIATRTLLVVFVLGAVVTSALVLSAPAAHGAPMAPMAPTTPTAPPPPTIPSLTPPSLPGSASTPTTSGSDATISFKVPNLDGTTDPAVAAKKQPGQSVLIILLLTLLAVAPALLMMFTSFTRIVIVLSLTRNALGLQSIPPNQVVVGLSLFLSLFVMAPTLSKMNDVGLQPLLKGDKTFQQSWDSAQQPLKEFMLGETRKTEINLFLKASRTPPPKRPQDISLTTLVPAFVLSEIKTAFIIGFVVFVPFLIIDLVVSSTLMSMGMFMLPPVLVSLPFKLLLFVMVDGWGLVVKSLVTSFNTG